MRSVYDMNCMGSSARAIRKAALTRCPALARLPLLMKWLYVFVACPAIL